MKRDARFLWPYLWRYRRAFALGLGSLIVKDGLGAALPLAMRGAVDSIAGGRGLRLMLAFCGLIVLVSLCKGVFQYWMRVILIGVSRDVEYDMRNQLFARLVTLDSGFFGRTRTGDIMARATNDMNAVRMMLGPGLMYLFETSLTLVLALAVMLWVDWPLTLVALIPAPFVSLAVLGFGRQIHERFESIQRMFSDISSRVQENLSGVRVVRAYVQERSELALFENVNGDYIRENLRLARISGLFNPLLSALIGITFLLVLWMGGLRLMSHKISLGSFVMFQTYMGMLIWPMIAMGWVANLLERGRASLSRVRELLEERPAIAAPANPRALPAPVRGAIEFRNVGVRYGSRMALENVDLRIPAGTTVAIVGHTGSGKSTLAHLIPRLIDPSAGMVALDGIDLREFSPEDVRSAIGYVPQETFLFSATLAENIAFGVKDATEDQIRRAAEIAGLAPDIAGFPNGYKTMVGERGITLSGGQKQRTAIARAILRDPRILILDDALASVDTATEERILNELQDVMHGRTTILISHRVSTIRNADRIFVLEKGTVVAEGSHAELLERGGYYADLFQKQLLEEELEAI
ncbi:MAG TPA: ABC transporter ATP-binding protein [Bryobacteraceae bacterium]|jgi:ATP-binding cassette subfamily B multidrug efflux pump|nr:ABC transporter ATP-binding protein [Bryobacteraceae bacterium]